MRLMLFAIAVCLNIAHASGQANISLGKPYVVIDAEEKYYFHRGNEILSVKLEKSAVTIQKFNEDDVAFQKIKLYDDFPKGHVVESVTKFQDKYYVFYSLWDGENEQLFAREINFKEGQFYGPGVKIMSVHHRLAGFLARTGFYRFQVEGKFSFFFSGDSSKVFIQYRLKPEVKSDNKSYDVVGINIYDKNLTAQWRKEVQMPYTEKKMDIFDYTVDAKNNAYILARLFDDNTTDIKDKDGTPNYSIQMLKISGSTGALSEHPVSIPDKFIKTIWIYEHPKGYLLCTGFYNVGNKSSNVDGVLAVKIADSGKLYDVSTYEIPTDILNQYVSGKTQRQNERKEKEDAAEFENLKMREVLIDQDGGMLLVGEQDYSVMHTRYSSTGAPISTYYTFHYNDMLVTKVKPDGGLAWMKKLPKRQTGMRGRGGMSYKYIKASREHYFLFLDNEKNKDLPLDKVPAIHQDGQGGFLTAYKIDDVTGETKKMSILDTRNVKGTEVFQFMPSRIVATGKREFVFEVYKKKKEDILVKVVL